MPFRYSVLVLTSLVVAACSTPTPYVEATQNSGYGFSSERVADDEYQVRFRGNESTPRDRVEQYLLYYAADLTNKNGYDYFVFVQRFTETTKTFSVAPDVRPEFAQYKYDPDSDKGSMEFPYYPDGYSWQDRAEDRVVESTCYCAIAFVKMYKQLPDGIGDEALKATDVIAKLKSEIEFR